MRYTIKAHPTKYKNVLFRSRLEARWAAFFDLVGWEWEYEPLDLPGWSPDFRVTFSCRHSECGGSHALLVEVKPYFTFYDFRGHPCLDYSYGFHLGSGARIPADAGAGFGANPSVSQWEMCHGDGGGVYSIADWCETNVADAWTEAGNVVQWRPHAIDSAVNSG